MKKEIEAILFMSDRNISLEELAEFYETSIEEIKKILEEIELEKEDQALNVEIKNGFAFLKTNPILGEVVTRFFDPTVRIKKLSKTSMETLTIIAFKGPMTKSAIESIKGVSVDGSLQVLIEKKLVVSKERLNTVGNPKLYEVTDKFYGYIGLESKEDLMKLDKTSWFSKESEEDEN